MIEAKWRTVDDYIVDRLVGDAPLLAGVLEANAEAGLPAIDVSAAQGKFLHLMVRIAGARRILELGTLGGYSTIWMAQALPIDARLETFEYEPRHADVARRNIEATYVPQRGDDGDVLGFVSLVADITERKGFERFRASAVARAERLLKITTAIADAVVAEEVFEALVDYVDAVDNGREKPTYGKPCITSIVGIISEQATSFASFDPLYVRASDVVLDVIRGLEAGLAKEEAAEAIVHAAMDEAVASGRNVILLDDHASWKKPYFARDGATHPTDFVLFPGERDVRVVAIPPTIGSFGQKTSFPEAWAGLTDDALSDVIGVPGAVFCHKNRFIAVFKTREVAEAAMRSVGLWMRG